MATAQPPTMLPSGRPRISILNLPPRARLRIYHFAGLIKSCPIAIVGSSSCLVDGEAPGTLPTSLFLVSQHISFESLREFFSGNRFMVIANSPSDLDDIRRLPRDRLVRMRSLEIYLNPRCITKTDNDSICLLHCKQGKRGWRESFPLNRALKCTTAADYGMILAFYRLCRYLKGIAYYSAHLICFCNAETSDVAAKIRHSIEPLQWDQRFSCEVRITEQSSSSPDPLIRSSIGDRTQPAFPFFRLPAELRFAILSYTDLHPGVGSDPYSEDLLVNTRLLTSYWTQIGGNRCFRTIPFPLFLVSKQMRKEAEDVLFYYNCLNINLGIEEAYKYLVHCPKERLHAIRHLQLQFRCAHMDWWLSRTRPAWYRLVEFIGENLNVSVLCLVIDISDRDIVPHGGISTDTQRPEYELICELVLDLCKLHLPDLHLNLPRRLAFLETLLEQKVIGPGYDSSRGNRRAKRRKGLLSGFDLINGELRSRSDRGAGVWTLNEVPEWHIEAWEAMTRSYGVTDGESKAYFKRREQQVFDDGKILDN